MNTGSGRTWIPLEVVPGSSGDGASPVRGVPQPGGAQERSKHLHLVRDLWDSPFLLPQFSEGGGGPVVRTYTRITLQEGTGRGVLAIPGVPRVASVSLGSGRRGLYYYYNVQRHHTVETSVIGNATISNETSHSQQFQRAFTMAIVK